MEQRTPQAFHWGLSGFPLPPSLCVQVAFDIVIAISDQFRTQPNKRRTYVSFAPAAERRSVDLQQGRSSLCTYESPEYLGFVG